MALSAKPDFTAISKKWLKYWESKKIYKFDPKSKEQIYSIDTPPPTVSGKMHVGHAFSYSQQDFFARYQRMLGKNVFYPFGTDDNGLATERLIEKEKKVKATKMPRDEFIKLCLKTLKEIRPDFIQDWKNIGLSADFSLYYSTIDDHSRAISQWSFIDLYKQGREYRKEAPTIWCPHCETAIAQAELEDLDIDTQFNTIKFKLENGSDLLIATTRPELLGSCVGIFVNPDDHRYEKLIGKRTRVPLFDRSVPIMKDARVMMDKGTGAVMCCTFGDQTDIEWFKAYNLPLMLSITKDGRMNEKAGKYAGLKIDEARKAIIEDLQKEKLLAEQKKIKHTVNVHERCKTPVEILNTKQWFIKYLDLKDEFLKAGRKLKWQPEYMRTRYENWIKGLQWDWLISRQRFFGVPFPVWYCKKCSEVMLANVKDLPVDPLKDKAPVKSCPKCKSTEFVPEKDVLDTWATSSLSPKLSGDLHVELREKLFPMDLRPQAHDIVTTWLFYTVVKAHLHTGLLPWKHATISGHVQDPNGKAMHKSLGNVIAPQPVVEKYGADALRYFASTKSLGEDAPFQEKELQHSQKLQIKLWNVARFVEMWSKSAKPGNKSRNIIDNWIKARLVQVVKQYHEAFGSYSFFAARKAIEDFFWHEYCDYYLEMIKHRLYGNDKLAAQDAASTLKETFYQILQMFAPIMPFITEELYQELYKHDEVESSIHLTDLPQYKPVDTNALELGNAAVDVIGEIRKYKASKGLGPGAELEKLTVKHPNSKADKVLEEVAKTSRVKHLHIEKGALSIKG